MITQDFEAFFREQYGPLVRHLVLQGFPRELATEAAEEAMYRLLQPANPVTSPVRWVRTVARNEALRLAEREDRQHDVAYDHYLPIPAPADPAHVLDARAEAERVLALLRSLPEQQRHVMTWYLDGFKPAEIAEILDIKRSTVDSNLRHARNTLRAIWTSMSREEER